MNYLDNLFNLNGKVAVVTGAGILGSSMCIALVGAGVKVAVLNRGEEKAVNLAQKLKQSGAEAIGLKCNVLEESELENARSLILKKWGQIDILINGAGGNMAGATIGPDQTVFDMKLDAFRKVVDLNLVGSVLPSLVFGKHMAEQKSGTIVNISSMTANQAVTRVFGYSVSKAAIESFTKWMATEMAHKFGDKIRVNAIAPGFFIGEQNRRLLTNEDGSLTARGETIIKNTPMKRFGEADELSGVLLWLVSDASRFVTGTVIPVDGGFGSFSGV